MTDAITAMAAVTSDLRSLAQAASAPALTMPDPTAGTAAAAGPSFVETLTAALDRADGAIASANSSAKAFAGGNRDLSLSDVMVSLEQANLALQTAATVRDKVTAAYSTVMNMQI